MEGERRKREGESDRNRGMLIEGNRQRGARRDWIVLEGDTRREREERVGQRKREMERRRER